MAYNIKKATAIFFILLANIFILAHGVIPHHHHDGIPVAATHHEHDGSVPDHRHTDDAHEVWLSTKVNARLGNEKQICRSFVCGFDLLSCLPALFSDYSTFSIQDDAVPFRHPPYIQLQHTESIARSIGLRAPPFQ